MSWTVAWIPHKGQGGICLWCIQQNKYTAVFFSRQVFSGKNEKKCGGLKVCRALAVKPPLEQGTTIPNAA
jgi:hypothetical protein